MTEQNETTSPTPEEQDKKVKPQVIYLENGQVVWPEGVFHTIQEVEAFLQRNVYRDWENKVFGNIMADLLRKNQRPPQTEVPQDGSNGEAPQPAKLQVVPDEPQQLDTEETELLELEQQLAALKNRIAAKKPTV